MSNFAGTDRTVACGAIGTSGQPCVRRVVPGESCGYHPAAPLPEPEPRLPARCRCDRPVPIEDPDADMASPRCLLCGRWAPRRVASEKRGSVRPSNALNGIAPV